MPFIKVKANLPSDTAFAFYGQPKGIAKRIRNSEEFSLYYDDDLPLEDKTVGGKKIKGQLASWMTPLEQPKKTRKKSVEVVNVDN